MSNLLLGKRIALVDDNNDGRTIAKMILSNAGYKVTDFASGRSAIDGTKDGEFDLVVLDIMMPEVDGYQVISALKSNDKTKDIPVIFLTARGEPEEIISGYTEHGADYYISKPYSASELLNGVKIVLTDPLDEAIAEYQAKNS